MNQQRGYFQHVDTYDEYPAEEVAEPTAPKPTGTLTKQFQPKKLKDANKLWNKDSETNSQVSYSTYNGNNKAATLGNTSLGNTTPKRNRSGEPHTGTLRPPKASPFVYDPPTTQSTPKMPRAQRSESAAGNNNTMSREQKLTWGRVPPNPAHFRSASAMGTSTLTRPLNRPNEFTPMGQFGGSRYQSYCTLPRPEQMDPETLSQIQMQLQMHPPHGPVHHPFYDPTKMVPPQMVTPQMRPPSALSGGPPMAVAPLASNLAAYVPPHSQKPIPSPREIAHMAIGPSVVNWNLMSLVSCMQVLCCVGIFGVGVARMLYGSLWAIGVEIVFATCAVVPALVGIYAVKRGSYAAAVYCYIANVVAGIFATVPLLLGLFPVFTWIFPKVDSRWLVSSVEPLNLDFALSLLVLLEIFLSFVVCVSGCSSLGKLFISVDNLKLHNNVKAAFEDNNPIPYNSRVHNSKKGNKSVDTCQTVSQKKCDAASGSETHTDKSVNDFQRASSRPVEQKSYQLSLAVAIAMFRRSRQSVLVSQLREELIFAELQEQLDAAERKRELEREWVDRLWNVYSASHDVLAEFRRLVFQFAQRVVAYPDIPVTPETLKYLKGLTEAVREKLSFSIELLNHEKSELSELYSQYSRTFILDAQKTFHLIAIENNPISKDLDTFLDHCNVGKIDAKSMESLKESVADLYAAVAIAPSWEKLHKAVRL
ncbi:unnamed protein product [Caenorhabditis auriculariae]|uniref:Uncharacterized protein n=1 Tax=Caenorhabditis auriculariae TaxID=2777116 RepID=A0A8S1HD07_9PELO|nr:unnamed protein product [Caenorhabditis auriculariae]